MQKTLLYKLKRTKHLCILRHFKFASKHSKTKGKREREKKVVYKHNHTHTHTHTCMQSHQYGQPLCGVSAPFGPNK